jgi:hypothetical protein
MHHGHYPALSYALLLVCTWPCVCIPAEVEVHQKDVQIIAMYLTLSVPLFPKFTPGAHVLAYLFPSLNCVLKVLFFHIAFG